jgi:nucleoside-diphosphate-sugar epimerase
MTENLIVFGPGYTGQAILRAAAALGVPARGFGRASGFGTAAADVAIAGATALVSTVPPDGLPDGGGDPVLRAHGAAIAAAQNLRWVGYCSTTGVYGNRDGGWVDEATPPAPGQPRSQRRLEAEQAWRAALPAGAGLDLMRIAGIYGPGRSALEDVAAGTARRVDRPGHAFGRIHVEDIAGTVLAALARPPAPGQVRVLNLADDEPAPQADVVAEAARLLGVAPPKLVPFEQALSRMGEMGRGFWAENRRVANTATKAAIGRKLAYPTYREGLAAIFAQNRAQQRG